MHKVYWTLAVAAWLLVSTVASHDLGVTPDDPNAAPADPSAPPADPSTAPPDPTATPADPSATHSDPVQEIAAIVGSMQYLLGEVIGHQQNAETLGKGIYARLEDIASRQQGMESQQEDIASRQQGVESQLEDIASRQQTMESQLEDIASRQQSVESQLKDIASRQQGMESQLEGVETRQNYTTETLTSVAAETRILVTPRDCSDLPPGSHSGVYQIRLISGGGPTIDAYCNQTIAGGGWTVFQRRADIQPRQNFYLTWENYKLGFGNLDEGEFWWGLEKLRRMTSSLDRKFQLRIDLEDEDGNWGYADYDNFRISSEADGYRLHASNFRGDVGDSLTLYVGRKFTTKDRDQDINSYSNCAHDMEGAWWYSNCVQANLNGRYKPGTTHETVVYWKHWRNKNKCLKTVEMKLRPV